MTKTVVLAQIDGVAAQLSFYGEIGLVAVGILRLRVLTLDFLSRVILSVLKVSVAELYRAANILSRRTQWRVVV